MQIDNLNNLNNLDKIIYVHPAKIIRNNRRKIIKEVCDKIDTLSLDTIDNIIQNSTHVVIRRRSQFLNIIG